MNGNGLPTTINPITGRPIPAGPLPGTIPLTVGGLPATPLPIGNPFGIVRSASNAARTTNPPGPNGVLAQQLMDLTKDD